MKLKTNIARLLATGLFLNNIYFYSNANTLDDEILGRYETLEGEYIAIDDSAEGNLEEIEIFGNTIQNPNNLEDIQSVGDLYVDEDGNPILDKQGRQQYKIDIISSNNGNLLNGEWEILNFGGAGEVYPNSTYRMTKPIEIYGGQQYTLSFKEGTLDAIGFGFYDKDNNIIKTIVSQKTVTAPINAKYIRIRVGTTDSLKYPLDNINEYEIKLEVGNKTSAYRPFDTYVENKITILLPCQLQKVKNVADRLYWDNNKGRYVIEKNIKDVPLDFFQDKKFTKNATNEYRCIIGNAWNTFDSGPVRDRKIDSYTRYNIYSFADHGGNAIYVYYNIDNLNKAGYLDETSETLYNAFFDDVIAIKFALKESYFIETNITSKLKVPIYEGKTYIFTETENGINPTLKVTVDRLPQIAKNAIEEAENDSTSSNISLARMYINMLPESLYKDQLQEQLSEVFSSDITLDRNTVTSNLDIYVKSDNMLSLSLDTNSVTFEGYSGVEDAEILGAVSININSSLPYQLNAYLPIEISNSDKSNILPMNLLNIKESSETDYKQFANTTDKIVLKDSCNAGNNSIHNIDLKLASNQAHKADIYKTVIKFEAEQK